MDFLSDHLFWSRFQFALTTGFHILWASMSIGLAAFLVVVEGLWLKTREDVYYRHARFWGKLFVLVFAVGVVTGIPLGFQFGTNWERFSVFTGGFFGNLLSFEATMAFMLESAFLGLMIFGWNRVPRGVHFLSTLMVAFGASLSAFWIMVANSWMQTPAGGRVENGRFVLESTWDAIFNPDWFLGVSHMWIASLETVLFVVGGLSAWKILTNRQPEFFTKSFKIVLWAAVIVAPLQFLLGDSSGRMIALHQPAKLAATEAHWETNPEGASAGWNALVWPNPDEEKNDFQIQIPWGLSLIITHSLNGQVKGLKEIPRQDRPPIILPFYAFRIMMGIGFFFIFLALWTIWAWWTKRLAPDRIREQKPLLFLWVCSIPLGYLAILTGWVTREVGRQPWLVHGWLRTEDAATSLPASAVGTTVLGYGLLYTVLFVVFWLAARGIMGRGPDLTSPVPSGKGGGQ